MINEICDRYIELFVNVIVFLYKSQIKGKESENSYQELKRSPKDTHTQTVSRYFDRNGRLSQSEESKYS